MANINPYLDRKAKSKPSEPSVAHYGLAAHVNAVNLARSEFFPDLVFGDPIWAVTLDLFVSEQLERSTNIVDVADRLNLSYSVCERCIQYLIDKSAIFENFNAFTKSNLPVLTTEKTKLAICSWLDSCTVETAPI